MSVSCCTFVAIPLLLVCIHASEQSLIPLPQLPLDQILLPLQQLFVAPMQLPRLKSAKMTHNEILRNC